MSPYEIVSVCFGAVSIVCTVISCIGSIVSIKKEKEVKEHLKTIIHIKNEIQITKNNFTINKDCNEENCSTIYKDCQFNFYGINDPRFINDGLAELHKKGD